MSKIREVKERVHQPYWDTLVRGIGRSAVSNLFQLFGNANVGDRSRTNLQTPGQFASDSHYVIRAMRSVLAFQGLNDPEFTAVYGTIPALTGCVAVNARAQDLYNQLCYGSTFTLTVANKPMLQGPMWYIPTGGGPFGSSTVNDRHVITNGMPTHEAILKLAKDIVVEPRQSFSVAIEFFPFVILGTGAGIPPAAISHAIDPLQMLNEFDGLKNVQIVLDGVITRDVQ